MCEIDVDGEVDDLTRTPDAHLVRLARAGDEAASAELWYRHSAAGRRAALQITRRYDADDLVQEAFARILAAIARGEGPDGAFRPYLYATIRNVSMSWARRHVDRESIDAMAQVTDPDSEFDVDALERSVAAKAFGSLRPEVREILWYTEVEGLSSRDAGRFLGLSPGAAATMAYRARDRLRTAWVQAHVSSGDVDPGCRWTVERLGAHARHTLARRDRHALELHLTACVRCAVVAEELDDVAGRLRAVLLPLVLGAPVAAQALLGTGVGAGTHAGAATSASATATPVTTVSAFSTMAAVASAVVGIAAVAAAVAGLQGAGADRTEALTPAPAAAPLSSLTTGAPGAIAPQAPATAQAPPPESPQGSAPAPAPSRPGPGPSAADPVAGGPVDLVALPHLGAALTPEPLPDVRPPVEPLPVEPSPAPGDAPPADPEPDPEPTAPGPGPAERDPAAVEPDPAPEPIPAPTDPAPADPAPAPADPSPEPAEPDPEPGDAPLVGDTPTDPTPPPAEDEPEPPADEDAVEPPPPVQLNPLAEGPFLPRLTGTAVPGALVVVETTDGRRVATTTTGDDGTWEVTLDPGTVPRTPWKLTVSQVVGDRRSEPIKVPHPIHFLAPTLVGVAKDGTSVKFTGTAGLWVEAVVDGVPTGTGHLLSNGPLTRALPQLSPGTHELALRYYDPESSAVGAWVRVTFEVPVSPAA